MELIKQLKPKNALLGVQKGATRSIVPLLSCAPRVCSKESYQVVNDEWRHLPLDKFDDDFDEKNMEIDIFWAKLYELKTDRDEYLFKNVARAALL